ncbi:MAG: hypothetical protein ACE5H4_06040 [Candidatus Thorarchaeota archaeon]
MYVTKLKVLALAVVASIGLVSLLPSSGFALPDRLYRPTQVAEPFTEMLPGVYVAYEWWEDEGQNKGRETGPLFPAEPVEPPIDAGIEFTEISVNPTDRIDLVEYPPYPLIHVEDVLGNPYWIQEDITYEYSYNWSFSNLLVAVLLDPDGSYMKWLSEIAWFDVPKLVHWWGFFWWPEPEALSGDEVFIFSSFYLSEYSSSSYYKADFTWYDESMNEVDPNDVILNLAPEYTWASWMNESYEHEYDWSYTGYGFDINEMFADDNRTHWMNHYFSGLTAFNDLNDNGIMDIVYKKVEYDFDEDGVVDWAFFELDGEASENVYDFYAESAEIGDIVFPELNSDGEIEWSAEVVNINGNLMTSYPQPVWFGGCWDIAERPIEYVEPERIPVTVDSLEMVYRFKATDEAAVLKVDQHIGNFKDPETGFILPEANGLGLAAKYWSSFSGYTMRGELDDGTALSATTSASGEAPQGALRFFSESRVRTSVEFGGTYVWAKDGLTYEVGSAVIPNYYYILPLEYGTPSADLAYSLNRWFGRTYYYVSCYAKWDGYAITHDPIFSVFPLSAPGSVTKLIGTIVNTSLLVGAVGIVAIAVVLVRVNRARKPI